MYYLVKLEQNALKLRNEGKLKEAIEIYENIIEKDPNYEFGRSFYDLACCFEDIGELEKAEKNYLKAIEYDDEDEIRLGGYASFLYLYDNPNKAINIHLKLLKLKKRLKLNTSNLMIAINNLAEKLHLSKQTIEKLIRN